MANDLTGDFDVVAEFSIPAANRVLAAMHRGERVPHAWTLRVDDYNHIHIPLGKASDSVTATTAGIRAVTDSHGAVTDPVAATQVSNHASAFRGSFDAPVNIPTATPLPSHRLTDSVQDASSRRIPDLVALEKASHLMGVAQIQMGAPTISFGRSNTSIIVHTPVMARYTADEGYMEIPDLLRGEFQTTIEVQQTSSSAGMFINVKLGGKSGNASFVPKWVSPAWDNESDQLASINKAIVNALLNSFEPSSTQVPASIPIMNFKTLSGGSQPALAIMMDVPGGVLTGEFLAAALAALGGGPPPPIADPATVTNVFLGQDDDFALAICSNDIISWFASAVNSAIPGQQNFTTTTTASALDTVSYTFHTFTTITIDDAIVTLQPGQIVVKVNVHVHFSNDSSYVPSPDDFDFTITQAFNLALNGGSVSLQALGPLDVAIPSSVNSSIASFVKTNATNAFNNAWGSAGGAVQAQIGKALSVDNLQNFLKSLMNPVPKPGSAPLVEIDPKMLYTWYEIIPAGIVLHGVLQVPAWTKPQISFSSRTYRLSPSVPLPVTEYSALNSWIPGGTITEYIWNQQDGPVVHDDHNTFLFSQRNGGLFHLCLTAKGSRITASGPATYQTVSGQSFCGWHINFTAKEVSVLDRAILPHVALTRQAESGLEVLGHTSPWADTGALPENTANLIVHFPDEYSLSRLEYLPRDLQQASHENSTAAIIVVLTPDEFKKVKSVNGITFSDDEQGWSKLLHLKHRPATFLIDTAGDVTWQHQGPLSNAEFVSALRAHLPTVGGFAPRLVQPNVQIGSSVPNFIFETAPDQTLTLRKLAGRPVVLAFWKSTSQASIEAIRDLVDICANSGKRAPVVLAINDGEPPETVKHASKGIKAVVVPDPDRAISAAFGINLWPTSIYLDANGLITDICYGRFCGGMQKTSTTAAAD